ncbi:transcriptional regulator [Candidatus Falkowbacteria bacterium CG10_big_fil_rev_8_21_14_0_10_43_10]|uniref:Transcriptional regulator n=1 Tax=Candidatus Falkowbacteria bacterium CG10_big_fil_rev_8_21_14_0_10_43_10 TaxID=1974567 RepID=A0A2H0V182_9BACT|nr:MAG: transcriptional regulator [Candidatus Falkowbacteria bacterium CG10_big_fil_rev_8_21_14_0_10_43_10]
MQTIQYISIEKLRTHERTSPTALAALREKIKRDGFLKNPVIVEKRHRIVLDGHHRLQALKDLGCTLAPVFLVDYMDKKIRVAGRRPNISVSKEKIIMRALAEKCFPYKTTRHFIPGRPRAINISLAKLMK